jgi:hypothetical protein
MKTTMMMIAMTSLCPMSAQATSGTDLIIARQAMEQRTQIQEQEAALFSAAMEEIAFPQTVENAHSCTLHFPQPEELFLQGVNVEAVKVKGLRLSTGK